MLQQPLIKAVLIAAVKDNSTTEKKENCTNHPERHNGRYADGQGVLFGALNVLCVSTHCPLLKMLLRHL